MDAAGADEGLCVDANLLHLALDKQHVVGVGPGGGDRRSVVGVLVPIMIVRSSGFLPSSGTTTSAPQSLRAAMPPVSP